MLNKKKILAIVPNEMLKNYFAKLFDGLNYKLKILFNTDDLVDEIELSTPDSIFIYKDIKDAKGNDVYNLIINRLLNTKIIFVIYSFSNVSKNEEENFKNVSFLKFPIEQDEFKNQLSKIIEKKKIVLYVDDSKVMHSQIAKFLKANNFIVFQAYNGEEGLKILPKCKPDIILSDVEMPIMDGFDFCKAVKNNPDTENIPFVILSALGSGLDVDRGFDSGANDYLTKPVDTEELLFRISDILDEKKKRTREKILVVDDSKTIRNLMKQALEQQGFKVHFAVNGQDGYEKAQELEPDLITSDYDMPIMNGWDFCQLLRKDKKLKSIPVIMLTSRDSKSDKAKIRGSGAKEYLTKPFNTDKLIVVVERLLAERQMDREREILKFYVSDAVFSEALSQGLSGSQKPESMQAKEIFATVVFTDIASFTPLCEKLTPKEVINLLNEYFDVMCTALKNHNAIIDKFIGDAIMSIFGDGANGAYNAVAAGLEMLSELKKFNKGRKNPIKMRIGINSGKLYFGDLGSKLFRRDFTVIGDNVNIGQRLESQCKINSVYISESTYDLVKDYVKADLVGPLELKGKKTTIDTYEVHSILKKSE
jgi:adenylate cyclase